MLEEVFDFSARKVANILGLTVIVIPIIFFIIRAVYWSPGSDIFLFNLGLIAGFLVYLIVISFLMKKKNKYAYIVMLPYLLAMIVMFMPFQGFMEAFSDQDTAYVIRSVANLVFFVLCAVDLPFAVISTVKLIRIENDLS